MSIINTFLQKKKMRENHYGIFMVAVAYVLSFLLLVLGSDTFYNSRSRAAGINNSTDEVAQEIINNDTNNEILTSEIVSYDQALICQARNNQSINTGILSSNTSTNELVNTSQMSLNTRTTQTKLVNPYGLAENTEEDLPDEQSMITTMTGDTNWLLGYPMDALEYNIIMEQMNGFDNLTASHQTQKVEKNTIESFSVEVKTNSSFMSVTDEEVEMLERIVESEATGEDMIGKILIVNVILNRMSDEDFPDSIEGVIFQRVEGDYQFSPIKDQRFWEVNVTKNTRTAVQRALDGEDYSEGALYFMARKNTKDSNAKWFDQHLERLFKHGGHEFYK